MALTCTGGPAGYLHATPPTLFKVARDVKHSKRNSRGSMSHWAVSSTARSGARFSSEGCKLLTWSSSKAWERLPTMCLRAPNFSRLVCPWYLGKRKRAVSSSTTFQQSYSKRYTGWRARVLQKRNLEPQMATDRNCSEPKSKHIIGMT